ncbi:PIN domain-containing protein [Candidatus Peregrinibacteria bacterium]|nr:PIN domain-containing protein [Candidatus Peregrinibacteria bacterium]
MENLIFIDTHVVVWLYDGKVELLSDKAKKAIQDNILAFSPVVELELQYLFEIGRIRNKPHEILKDLKESIGLKSCDCDLSSIIRKAVGLTWTRDPFDRIMTAQALFGNLRLLTKDTTILKNYKKAFWD